MATKITNLSDEIIKCLNDYTDEVEEALEKTKEKLAEEGVKELKKMSPKKTGKYSKGWNFKNRRGKVVIYNKKHYRLTHLLEKGHKKRGGKGTVAAIPHISTVEKNIQKKATEEFKKH